MVYYYFCAILALITFALYWIFNAITSMVSGDSVKGNNITLKHPGPVGTQISRSQPTFPWNPIDSKLFELLLRGNYLEALEWAMDNQRWGHAFFLAFQHVGQGSYTTVLERFVEGMDNDNPLKILHRIMFPSGNEVVPMVGQLLQLVGQKAPSGNQPLEVELTKILLGGNKKEALELTLEHQRWGHAFFLALKHVEQKSHARVLRRFVNSMADNDPLQILYRTMNTRQDQVSYASQFLKFIKSLLPSSFKFPFRKVSRDEKILQLNKAYLNSKNDKVPAARQWVKMRAVLRKILDRCNVFQLPGTP